MNILAICALGIAQPSTVVLSIAPLIAEITAPCDIEYAYHAIEGEQDRRVHLGQSQENQHATTSGKYIALNDGGCQLSGIWNDKKFFYDLRTGSSYKPAKMGNGSLCPILGYGTIKLKVPTTQGVRVVTLRNQAYSPECEANIVGQNDLVKEGFTFVRGGEGSYVERNSDGLRITLQLKQGLTFWNGIPLNKTNHPNVKSINDNTREQYTGVVAATTTTNKLIDILNDQTLTNNKHRRTLVRKRAAELGCYISDNPKTDKLLLLHQQLGHCSIERCVEYLKSKYRSDPTMIKRQYGPVTNILCESCDLAKVKKAMQQKKKPAAKPVRFGDLSFSDISGPHSTVARATTGYIYELMVVDAATGYKSLYGMSSVKQTSDILMKHFKWVERATGKSAKAGEEDRKLVFNESVHAPGEMRLRVDNGSTYVSEAAQKVYDDLGLTLERAGSEMQWQNGGVERAWASIHTRSQAMRNAAGLDKGYWYLSDLHAVKLDNMLMSKTNQLGLCPYEAVFGTRPTDEWLRTFGQKCVVKQLSRKSKYDIPGRAGRWVGYAEHSRSHRVFYHKTATKRAGYVETQHVRFPHDETLKDILSGKVPLESGDTNDYDKEAGPWRYDAPDVEYNIPLGTANDGITVVEPEIDPMDTTVDGDTEPTAGGEAARRPRVKSKTNTTGFAEGDELFISNVTGEHFFDDKTLIIIGEDELHAPSVDGDGTVNTLMGGMVSTVSEPAIESEVKQKVSEMTVEELDEHAVYHDEYTEDMFGTVFTAVSETYTNTKKALESKWGKMFELSNSAEVNQMFANGTIRRVLKKDVPTGHKIFPSIKMHLMKANPGGEPIPKSRWVFNGASQVVGVDGGFSTTNVMRWSTLRMIMSYAAGLKQPVLQADLPNAYGLVSSDRPRYMYAPPGEKEHDLHGNEIVYECANIYGTKFGGRLFCDGLAEWLTTDMGFRRSEVDPSLYVRKADETHSRLVLGTWIDDLVFTAGTELTTKWFSQKLNDRWATEHNRKRKDCKVRIADFVVGCHVEQEPGRIRLHHKLLATKLINDFRVQDCNPIYTPFASGTEVKKSDCCTEEDLKESYISKYKSGVATVLYLACTTRPELAKFASELGKVQHRPGRKHFAFLKHVVKYIATHDEDGIVFAAPKEPTEKPAELIGYADASWADQRDDRRSTGGYVCFFNGGPISWFSKILRAVALSSAESELYAACLATQDVVHLRRVLEDMTGVAPSGPTTIYEDNNAVIFMTADKAKNYFDEDEAYCLSMVLYSIEG
jgi:hypothetical protein